MNHWTVQTRLSEYLDGDLALSERALLDAHLDRCERCSAELEALRNTVALLRNLPAHEPPARFADSVMERLRVGEGRPSPWGWLSDAAAAATRPWVAGPVAALAAGAWVVLLGPGPESLVPWSAPAGRTAATGPAAAVAQPESRATGPGSTTLPDPFPVFTADGGAPFAPHAAASGRPPGLRGGSSASIGEEVHATGAGIARRDPAADALALLLDDPMAFVLRTDRLAPSEMELLVQGLARRAAHESMTPDVARALRETRHPLRPELMMLLEPGAPEVIEASR